MIANAKQQSLLRQLSNTWPPELRPEFTAENRVLQQSTQALNGEIAALLSGTVASLPYFKDDDVLWFTAAPDSDGLQYAVEDLRAWIIPSFAWEEPSQPYILPGNSTGTLSELILSVSPAGYFRWRTKRHLFDTVAAKLRDLRQLAGRQPAHTRVRVLSLLELRQQFSLALLTGDPESADDAIRAIDHRELDSALNTQFMRVRLRDEFHDYEAIVRDPALPTLVRARMPHAIRVAIVRAFYLTVIAPLETTKDVDAAIVAYSEHVHPTVGGLLEFCDLEDGTEVVRTLAYRARHRNDVDSARKLQAHAPDLLGAILSPLLPTQPTVASQPTQAEVNAAAARSLSDEWSSALNRGDLRHLQEVGHALLTHHVSELPLVHRSSVLASLRASLDELPNEPLLRTLDGIQSDAVGPEPPSLPQSWPAFLDRLRQRDWVRVFRFLESTERPAIDALGPADFDAVVEALEELLTAPWFQLDPQGAKLLREGLPVFIEEFVGEQQFPRRHLSSLYVLLLRLWAKPERASTSVPEGHVLLTLARAVLESSERDPSEVADLVRGWWQQRRVQALLPFVLEGVELLAEQLEDLTVPQALWIDGADMVRRESDGLSDGERSLWRRLGVKLGIDEATVDEYVGVPRTTETGRVVPDTISAAGLTKIAIVSLHDKAARDARDLIAARTEAKVIVVAETHPGAGVRSAVTADVILFVWSANKHAVFRAFDSVRERLAYVQGTGATSIVLALERKLLVKH